MKGEKYIPF
jgi:hypothetical protein